MKRRLTGNEILQAMVARQVKMRQEARLKAGPDAFIDKYPNFFKEEEMKRYIGVKIVEAKPMTRGEYNKYRGWTIPANENPKDEGYLVVYPDDYESWSPKNVFEEAYRQTDGGMTFGHAIEAMKKGLKVTRRGWNGKGMYIYMTPGITVPRHRLRWETAEVLSGESGPTFSFNSHIDMKAADGSVVVGWLASQTDMLEEDWIIAE